MTGIFLVCTAAVLWGTTGVANTLLAGPAVDPALVGLVRTTLGALCLLLAAEALRLPWAGRLPLHLLAIFGLAGAVFQVCLFAAFVQVGVTVTVAVTVCAPVILVVMQEAAGEQRWPERGMAVAIVIAAVGVVLALTNDTSVGGIVDGVDWQGAGLLSAASVAFAVVASVARVMARDVHPLRATGLGLGVTAGVLALVVLCSPGLDLATLGRLPATDMAILGYTGVVATGLAYLAFVVGLHRSRSAAAGLTATLIEPGVAALLAALMLHERLLPSEAAGCMLMLVAMVVLFLAEKRAGRAADTRKHGDPTGCGNIALRDR